MKNRGGSQPWRNPQKSLSDKVANHSPACPDSELECLGDMQIIKPNKVLQLLRRKVWPNKMHFSQWQKFSHSTSEIFIHKRQLHVAHNRGTALSPCVQVEKLSYFKIREKNNKHSAVFIFGFCFHQFFFFFLWDSVKQGLKIHYEFRKYCWKGDWNHTPPESELSQKDFGLWSDASDTHYDSHLLLYLYYLCLLILLIFQNDSFCQRDKWVSRWAPEQRNFLFSVQQAHQTK